MNSKRILLFVAALLLLIGAIFALSDDMLSPYVSFAEAKSSAGKYVQIIGHIADKEKVRQDEKGYSFVLKEKTGDTLRVDHRDIKPLNFEHAEQVVVLGRYQGRDNLFHAEKVLVKCPSKYEKTNNTSKK